MCREEWTPDSSDELGCEMNNKSLQADKLSNVHIGSFIVFNPVIWLSIKIT